MPFGLKDSMTPRPIINTGYSPPSKVDSRNFILEKAQPVQPFPATFKTDLIAIGVYDQGSIPDCVENSITKIKQYHIFKVSQVVTNLSRRFLAALTVKADGFPISNGTSLLNALKIAQKQGISEAQYFLDDHNLDETTFCDVTQITPDATANAQAHTIKTYAFLSDLSMNGLKNAIYQNGCVILGLKLDKNWWSAPNGNVSWAEQDILPLRPPTDAASTSGHAIVAYAYDETYIYVWNSFGAEWGRMGHGWFGTNYLPFIYEAATILDLTVDQIKAQIVTQNDVVQVAQQDSQHPNTYLQSLLALLEKFVESYTSLQATPEHAATHNSFLETVDSRLQQIKNLV